MVKIETSHLVVFFPFDIKSFFIYFYKMKENEKISKAKSPDIAKKRKQAEEALRKS